MGGATSKDVLEDPETGTRYIAKLGGRNSDLEVMTEYAIYLIGVSLGVDVAGARIALYRGRLRFLSRYFLNPARAEELVHGIQLFRELYDEHTVLAVQGRVDREQALFNVQSVQGTFGAHYLHYGPHVEVDLFRGFVTMLTHDAIIGVQDRHHENWGVIVERGRESAPPRFAPLYDSARGLFCNSVDEHLQKFFDKDGDERLRRYVAGSRPLVGFGGLAPVGRAHLTHDELLAALYREYPEYRQLIRGLISRFDARRIHALLRQLSPLCSPSRRHLIVACLQKRRDTLLAAIDAAED